MIPEILFIDQLYITQNSPLSINVEGKEIRSNILISQDIHIQPILGTGYYRYLTDTSTTLTANEIVLISDFIRPACLHWFIYEIYDDVMFKMTASALAKKDTQNATPGSLEDLKYLKQKTRSRADFYTERLRKELCINNDLYPNYTSTINEDILPSTTNQSQPGMFFTHNYPKKYDFKTDRYI
jgi:hypothetical protein